MGSYIHRVDSRSLRYVGGLRAYYCDRGHHYDNDYFHYYYYVFI